MLSSGIGLPFLQILPLQLLGSYLISEYVLHLRLRTGTNSRSGYIKPPERNINMSTKKWLIP